MPNANPTRQQLIANGAVAADLYVRKEDGDFFTVPVLFKTWDEYKAFCKVTGSGKWVGEFFTADLSLVSFVVPTSPPGFA